MERKKTENLREYNKFDAAVDEGKGWLNPPRYTMLGQAPQEEGVAKQKNKIKQVPVFTASCSPQSR